MKKIITALLLVSILLSVLVPSYAVSAASYPAISKVSSKPGGVSITYKKVKNASKYVIQYSRYKSFKSYKKVSVKGTTKKITGLSSGKKYYIRVKAYKNKKYTSWSPKKSFYTGMTAKAMKNLVISKNWMLYSPQSVGGDLFNFKNDGTVEVTSVFANDQTRDVSILSFKLHTYYVSANSVTATISDGAYSYNKKFTYVPGKSYLKCSMLYSDPGGEYTINYKVFSYYSFPTYNQINEDWNNKKF